MTDQRGLVEQVESAQPLYEYTGGAALPRRQKVKPRDPGCFS